MTDKIICEKCGCEMIDRSSGDSIYIECPHCGWGWATTTYDPSLDDNTAYELWLSPDNEQSKENLQIIAKISHTNLLQAKKILNCSNPVKLYPSDNYSSNTFSRVSEIRCIAKTLSSAAIGFYVLPDFPYNY